MSLSKASRTIKNKFTLFSLLRKLIIVITWSELAVSFISILGVSIISSGFFYWSKKDPFIDVVSKFLI